ncbi:MAG: hypothetical protein Q9160_006914 [Pyrenula sp. 1 TL-2023]
MGKSWHDNPYHESLAIYEIPEDAVIGHIELNDRRLMKNQRGQIGRLLPVLAKSFRKSSLHRSLYLCIEALLNASPRTITTEDIDAAYELANGFDLRASEDYFTITMMFLCLRRRLWTPESAGRLLKSPLPSLDEYEETPEVIPEMLEKLELQRAMAYIRAFLAKQIPSNGAATENGEQGCPGFSSLTTAGQGYDATDSNGGYEIQVQALTNNLKRNKTKYNEQKALQKIAAAKRHDKKTRSKKIRDTGEQKGRKTLKLKKRRRHQVVSTDQASHSNTPVNTGNNRNKPPTNIQSDSQEHGIAAIRERSKRGE